jgi:hypothetical protein
VTVFRWIIGVLAALMAAGMVLSFVIGIVAANDIWMGRARRSLHWLWLALLLWFNVEVWGRVGWTLIHWKG